MCYNHIYINEEDPGPWGERKSGMARDFTWLYNMVKRIPKGSVASYGQLAMLAGKPGWARQVGRGMAACMDAAVPCHRVVRGDGSLPCAFGIGGPAQQRALLEGEGVGFLPDGRVDMARHRWRS